MKLSINLLLAVAVGSVAAIPTLDTTAHELEDFDPSGLEVVTYDSPPYQPSAEYLAYRDHAIANNLTYEAPAGIPRIALGDGQLLDLSGGGNLTKRDELRYVAAYGGYNCDQNSLIASVKNFGCGTGCIFITGDAYSALVRQGRSSNPKPTLDVWNNGYCGGPVSQHMGVIGTYSCTNTNPCCGGFFSFIAYYDCHH